MNTWKRWEKVKDLLTTCLAKPTHARIPLWVTGDCIQADHGVHGGEVGGAAGRLRAGRVYCVSSCQCIRSGMH